MATWQITDEVIGVQPLTESSATARHTLGKIVNARDTDTSGQGAGEFIYLLGIINTVVGLVVSYNTTTFLTTLVPGTGNLNVPLAVAMSANGAAAFGWYQISGNALVKKTAVIVTPQVPLFLSATAGRVKVIASAGKQVVNARSANLGTISGAVSSVQVMLQRPFAQGQIT